jgi:hypothetical protein
MGGLTILPDIKLDECSIERSDLLILPGGDTWTETIHHPLLLLKCSLVIQIANFIGRECWCNIELRTLLVGMVGRTSMIPNKQGFFVIPN